MTKDDLNTLRNKLPRGYMKRIKERTGFSEATIWKVLAGDFTNLQIIDAAIDLAREYQDTLSKQTENIKSL